MNPAIGFGGLVLLFTLSIHNFLTALLEAVCRSNAVGYVFIFQPSYFFLESELSIQLYLIKKYIKSAIIMNVYRTIYFYRTAYCIGSKAILFPTVTKTVSSVCAVFRLLYRCKKLIHEPGLDVVGLFVSCEHNNFGGLSKYSSCLLNYDLRCIYKKYVYCYGNDFALYKNILFKLHKLVLVVVMMSAQIHKSYSAIFILFFYLVFFFIDNNLHYYSTVSLYTFYQGTYYVAPPNLMLFTYTTLLLSIHIRC